LFNLLFNGNTCIRNRTAPAVNDEARKIEICGAAAKHRGRPAHTIHTCGGSTKRPESGWNLLMQEHVQPEQIKPMTVREAVERIEELADALEWQTVAAILAPQHFTDLADIIESLPHELHEPVFDLIDEDTKPDVLSELEGRASTDVLQSLTNKELAEIVEEMEPDDAADVLGELPGDRSEKILNLMEREESDDVRALMKYGEETAGGIMTTDLIALRDHLTVEQALNEICRQDEDEPFYYAYVVDINDRLVGWIGLWELVKIRDRTRRLSDLTHREIVKVRTDMDQEEVVRQMLKYDHATLPVVDAEDRLVGRVTMDDVMDVMEEEASEDIFRFAGSDDSELNNESAIKACRARLPWLLITLAAGFITSSLLRNFMQDLAQVLVLSFFVPIVLAMGGNTGIQSSTLIIRSMALGSLANKGIGRLLWREILAGAMMGIFCGLIIGIWAHFLILNSGSTAASYAPVFLAVTVGLVFGAFVPIVLHRIKVDPAVASGPFVTASNDILALLIYYGVAVSLVSIYHTRLGV
jgi:magnesium transporter